MSTLLGDGLTDWVDPGAVRMMVDSVRDGFGAAPVWARIGLLVILTFAVVTGVLRFAVTVAGRVVVMVVIAVVVGLALGGPAAMDVVSRWWLLAVASADGGVGVPTPIRRPVHRTNDNHE